MPGASQDALDRLYTLLATVQTVLGHLVSSALKQLRHDVALWDLQA